MDRDQLIIDHIEVARKAAAKFWRRGGMRFDLDDIQGEAALALVEAAGKWDENRIAHIKIGQRVQSRFAMFLIQRINWHLAVWADRQRGGTYHNDLVRSGKALAVRESGLAIPGRGKDKGELMVDRPDPHPTAEDRMVSEWKMEIVSQWMGGAARDALTRKQHRIFSFLLDGKDQAEIARYSRVTSARVGQIRDRAISEMQRTHGAFRNRS